MHHLLLVEVGGIDWKREKRGKGELAKLLEATHCLLELFSTLQKHSSLVVRDVFHFRIPTPPFASRTGVCVGWSRQRGASVPSETTENRTFHTRLFSLVLLRFWYGFVFVGHVPSYQMSMRVSLCTWVDFPNVEHVNLGVKLSFFALKKDKKKKDLPNLRLIWFPYNFQLLLPAS